MRTTPAHAAADFASDFSIDKGEEKSLAAAAHLLALLVGRLRSLLLDLRGVGKLRRGDLRVAERLTGLRGEERGERARTLPAAHDERRPVLHAVTRHAERRRLVLRRLRRLLPMPYDHDLR